MGLDVAHTLYEQNVLEMYGLGLLMRTSGLWLECAAQGYGLGLIQL